MHVVPRYTLPPIVNTLDPGSVSGLQQSVNPKASTGATTGTTSTTSADGGLGATFLNLLSTELQNQDPTAPVDAHCNGWANDLAQPARPAHQHQPGAHRRYHHNHTTSGSAQPASAASAATKAATPAAAVVPNQLPFNPDTMMPVNPALAPTPFDPSRTSNSTLGGK